MADIEKEVEEQKTAGEPSEEDTKQETAQQNDGGQQEGAEPDSAQQADQEAESKEQEAGEKAAGQKEGEQKEGKKKEAPEEEKKLFGKKEKKKDKAQEKIEELEDKVKRQLAEFENFRNRSEKEKTAMFETGAKSVIEKILPVIDNFERGLMTVPEDEKDSPFVDGMNKIYKQMVTELEAIGVKPIEAVGLEFDPNLHNAVMQVESEEYESGVVAQELQKGYTYHDMVVRHSMVAVVQ